MGLPPAARRLLALSGSDRRLLIWAFVHLGAVDLGLRLLGFERLLRRASTAWSRPTTEVRSENLLLARERARWLEVVSRHHPLQPRCLQCSLVLHIWLRRQGLPSELRIGVRRSVRGIAAHAWVELGGEVVNDEPTLVRSFAPLDGGHASQVGRLLRMR